MTKKHTMKKTYISPNAKTFELHFEGLIANSDKIDESNAGRGFDERDASYSNRRNSIWGDE